MQRYIHSCITVVPINCKLIRSVKVGTVSAYKYIRTKGIISHFSENMRTTLQNTRIVWTTAKS